MDLILWRHADAEDGDNDMARRLTEKGERQAARMASWLKRNLPDGYEVICSEASRAQQTAAFLKNKPTSDARINPGAMGEAYLQVAGFSEPSDRCLVLVGHQPSIGMALAKATGSAEAWSVRKGSICWLQIRDKEGLRQIVIRAVLGPEQLA